MKKIPFTKVVELEDDRNYLSVEFRRENGEKVIAVYKRCSWIKPPAKEAEEFRKIFTAAPLKIFRGSNNKEK
jgi:hypothetical protein